MSVRQHLYRLSSPRVATFRFDWFNGRQQVVGTCTGIDVARPSHHHHQTSTLHARLIFDPAADIYS